MPRSATIIALLTLVLAWGCNGWDDDSEFESRTRAAYFLAVNPLTGENAVHKYADGEFEMGWNQRFGISDGDVGDLFSSESTIWLSAASTGRLLEIDPADNSILQDISMPHRVDFFAIGARQIFAVDTAQDQYSFYRHRNGDVVTIDVNGSAGPVLYNNTRFYFQSDSSTISIIDEYALTSRAEATPTRRISDFQFNRFKNIVLNTSDASGSHFILLSGVDDLLVGGEAPVTYTKARYTPYLEARFGREWVEDVRLEGNSLISGAFVLADSVRNFEVDFFESDLYYQWGDSLYLYDLELNSLSDKAFFDWELQKSAYWLGKE